MPSGVAITGATGLLGTTLAASCARDGIPVSALVRNTVRAADRLPNATLFAWDATHGPPPEAAFEGVDTVVNLIGEPIDSGRWNDKRKKRLRDSRVVATRGLVDTLRGLARKPRLLISASGIHYYGNPGDQLVTEASAVGTSFFAELARDWEAEANKAAEVGMRVVLLRSGLVLAKQGGILRKILPPFRAGLGGRIGKGGQWTPWIHIEDHVGFIRHAMSHDSVSGAYNVVAPEPVTNAEFTRAVGEALGRPTVLKAPLFALRLVFGSLVDEVLLASVRAMPVRTLESGYNFRHPLLRDALGHLLADRRDDIAPEPTATT
jgi:uncharacterized protein